MNAREKRLHAIERANYWLSLANIAIEKGASSTRISMCERKAQYWLDRLNKIDQLR
jgi:hypothetical protein